MYLFSAEEIRSIHEERVGQLRDDYTKSPKTEKRQDPIKQLMKLFKRNES